MRATLILPTYNERETLPRLLAALRPLAPALGLDVLVVDDASPDGTTEVAAALAARGDLPLRVLRRPGKGGLASAVLAGAAASSTPVVAVMDSDGSHPPATLGALLSAVEAGADLAIASRYVPGGRVEDWPLWRRMASLTATAVARRLLGIRVRDPLSGYFAARRDVFDGRYRAGGFKILLEILVRHPQLRVVEVAYAFTDRAAGRSKLSWREIAAYLRLIGHLVRARGS